MNPLSGKSCFVSSILGLIIFGLSTAAAASAQTPGTVENYGEIIRNGTVEEKREALYQLRVIGTADASRAAATALGDQAPIVRATAASALGALDPANALQFLIPLLADKDAFVRLEAAIAIGELSSPLATEPLRKVLSGDKKREVRAAAAYALGLAGDPSAVPDLTAILRKKPSKKTEFLRRSAARSIGQIAQILRSRPQNRVTPESYLPQQFKTSVKSPESDLSVAYPEFSSARDILLKLLFNKKESSDVKREAVFALGEIGGDVAARALRDLLSTEDFILREAAEEALLKVAGEN